MPTTIAQFPTLEDRQHIHNLISLVVGIGSVVVGVIAWCKLVGVFADVFGL